MPDDTGVPTITNGATKGSRSVVIKQHGLGLDVMVLTDGRMFRRARTREVADVIFTPADLAAVRLRTYVDDDGLVAKQLAAVEAAKLNHPTPAAPITRAVTKADQLAHAPKGRGKKNVRGLGTQKGT